MPCEVYSEREIIGQLRAEVNHVTRLLCTVMYLIGTAARESLLGRVPGLRAWWDEHQRLDAERKRRLEEEYQKAQLREEVVARLTPAEREALGLRTL
jgi:hypothetical protein